MLHTFSVFNSKLLPATPVHLPARNVPVQQPTHIPVHLIRLSTPRLHATKITVRHTPCIPHVTILLRFPCLTFNRPPTTIGLIKWERVRRRAVLLVERFYRTTRPQATNELVARTCSRPSFERR